MYYLQHGDFGLPLSLQYLWDKCFYVWSFQTGAPNLDGIIRLPGRLFTLATYALFGGVVASYLYLAVSFLVVFISFYLFAKHFLNVRSRTILIVCSLLFTFNPAFLGYASKIGLVMAAGMLPLCLLLTKKFADNGRLRFLVALIVLLNLSLVHPFTFAVNFVVSAGYLIFRLVKDRSFKLHAPKLAVAGILAVLLNAYFLLPLVSVGSIDKAALSQSVTSEQADYFGLVDVSNTAGIFTAFSLSRDVFIDFGFYNERTQQMFIIGIYGLYGLAIGLFVVLRSRLTKREERTALVFLGSLLVLLLLVTGLALVSVIIKFLIGLPGGWAFRSPLKWQLYTPMPLLGILVLMLSKIHRHEILRPLLGVVTICFALSSTYLVIDIYENLLKPKQLNVLPAMPDLNNKTLLYVAGPGCISYAQKDPRALNEFRVLSGSRNVQVKSVMSEDLSRLNISGYDLILTCKLALQQKLLLQLDGDGLQLYQGGETITPPVTLEGGGKAESNVINPTKRTIRLSGIRDNVTLRMKDTYSPKWQLKRLDGSVVAGHFKTASFQNGWRIPLGSCAPSCELTMEYQPQRWFVVGLAVSLLTAVACTAIYFWRRRGH